MGDLRADVKLATHRVALMGSTVHIGHLDVSLDEAAEYLRAIPADKRELAFVHAVQVGMAEINARRRRFEMARQSSPAAVSAPRDAADASATQPTTTAPNIEPDIQSKVSPPLQPKMDAAAGESSEHQPPSARPQPEPDSWLRRLDEDFEVLDQL